MKELEYRFFRNREEFRIWLQENHKTNPGIWMIFYKKHLQIECIEYNEALEEALCFGWIDSLIKKIDNERYARKITPRINTRKWSEINKKKAQELIETGKMTQAGLDKLYDCSAPIIADQDHTKPEAAKTKATDIPDFIYRKLAENEPSLKNFKNLAPSYQRLYILWITDARKDETVSKRLNEAIALLKENKKLGLK